MQLVKKFVAVSFAATAIFAQADFQPEPVGTVETLPADYPNHWMMVHDFSFFHMSEGEIQVIDPLAETLGDQFKGIITASMIATYKYSAVRNEHYVAESFYARGNRDGGRSDFVTIWDPATLSVKAEIEIPAKRLTGMPKNVMSGLLDNDRFLGVVNFTPAQSVSIVDLEERKFVGEVDTPGCGFMLPHGQRSFTSICANGSLLTSHLNADGTLAESSRSAVAFDPEGNPIFESIAIHGDMGYAPTFLGQVLPLDLSGKELEVGEAWWLTSEDERNWRPGGMAPLMVDSCGTGYALMNPEGGEGTHKDGGAEVWVYDLASGERQGRIELTNWGVSLGTTGSGDNRLMIVTNADMALDVYRIPSGEFVHTLNTGAQTPFMVYGNQ